MKLRRYLSLLLAAAVLAGVLAGCRRSGPAADSGEEAGFTFEPWAGEDFFPDRDQYVLQIGHAQPADNPRHLSLLKFKEDVEKATCGHVRVAVTGDGALGSEREMLQQVMAGTIQGMRGGQCDYSPRLLMFALPFLTTDRAQISALLHSDLARRVREEEGAALEKVVILNVCDAGGYRQLSNSKHPVRTPEDLVGLKIRSNGMKTTDLTLEALGAEIESIPYDNLYTFLAKKTVDGQDNPWINSLGKKFYEVQPYFTELNYQFHPDPFYVNRDWWDTLPAEFQSILTRCAADMGDYNDQLIDQNNQAAKETIAAKCQIYTPTDQELDAFKRAVEPVYDACIADGVCTAEDIAEMREIVARAGGAHDR